MTGGMETHRYSVIAPEYIIKMISVATRNGGKRKKEKVCKRISESQREQKIILYKLE